MILDSLENEQKISLEETCEFRMEKISNKFGLARFSATTLRDTKHTKLLHVS